MVSLCEVQKITNAACKFSDDKQFTQTVTYVLPDLSFARNADINPNKPIYSSQGMFTPGGTSFTCNGGAQELKNNVGPDAPQSKPQLTGTTGLGFRINMITTDRPLFNHPKFVDGTSGFNNVAPILNLYKIGTISDNTEIPAGKIGTYEADGVKAIELNIFKAIKVTDSTCTTPNSIPVNMGKIKTTKFPSRQYTPAPPTELGVPLSDCPSFNTITYRLDPTISILRNGVVSLDSTSTAKGVAVQILDKNNNPLPSQTPNKLPTITTTGGNFNISLKTVYIRMQSDITAGSANTSLTYAMDYK